MALAIPILTLGLGALQASQQQTAAKIQQGESEISAKAEELGAIQREADRKGRLATALASQTASAGARGISAFEGSPLTILSEDIRREEVATQRDVFQTELGALTQRARGKIKSAATKQKAAIGLLSDVGRAAQSVPTKTTKAE